MSVSHPVRPPARAGRRLGIVGALVLTATLALAAPAAAHAEVEADRPQALAENVTLTFVSEAESASAGFREVRVVLPEGIVPADVTLAKAPEGWKFTVSKDGYTLAGPALKTGVDAEYSVKVRQLPDAEELAFKTVETYGDGEVSRWIELPADGEEAEQPAPLLKLKAAAPGAKPVDASPTPAETAAASPSTPPSASESASASASASPKQASADEDSGPSTGAVVGGAVAVLLVLGGVAWWLVRRRAAGASEG